MPSNDYTYRTKKLNKYKCITFFLTKKNYTHAYYRFYFIVDSQYLKKGWNRNKILKTLNQKNIECGSGSCPEIYKEKAIIDRGFQPSKKLKKPSISKKPTTKDERKRKTHSFFNTDFSTVTG